MKGACAIILAALLTIAADRAPAQSAFGCNNLDGQHRFAALEGEGGIFYRIDPDMRMFHPFSDHTADQIAALSAALATRGTTLIYVPVPTKSLAMPDPLPQAARDYGFDVSIATTVYLESLKKLASRGVLAVDARQFLRAGAADAPSFLATDPRMSANGTEREARAIADVLAATPDFATLPKGRIEASPTGMAVIESAMRSALQRHCLQPLPLAETETFASNRLQSTGAATDNAIFGAGSGAAGIAVVGTEIDGLPGTNLAGFVAKFTGLDTVHYAVPEGGAFAAISSYLTSGAFQDARPAYLVWSNPINNNLAAFGDQPFAELIAASGDTCRQPLPTLINPQSNSVVADLGTLDAGVNYTLFVDTGGAAAALAQFDFTSGSGQVRTKSVYRTADQVKTGRFYMPMTGLWPDGARTVEIRLDVPPGSNSRVMACFD